MNELVRITDEVIEEFRNIFGVYAIDEEDAEQIETFTLLLRERLNWFCLERHQDCWFGRGES